MGEVYRADDLKLGQPVALKFLPRHLAGDRDRLERFYAEVRIARQVSHPNVCRVYDVGEMDGQQYLSMEYVDGEDLASLLKRIGRLPPDKALDISRELCAGLAAAHERGVLHRDLKPANVMIDGRGRARITDFGLAVAAGEVMEGEISGTPAYMAPEQLSGKGASVRSDVYSLGLVLYELYTGRKAFEGATFQDLKRKQTEDPPTSPSTITPGFDPVVERVILRCLEKEPCGTPGFGYAGRGRAPGRRSDCGGTRRGRDALPGDDRGRRRAGRARSGAGVDYARRGSAGCRRDPRSLTLLDGPGRHAVPEEPGRARRPRAGARRGAGLASSLRPTARPGGCDSTTTCSTAPRRSRPSGTSRSSRQRVRIPGGSSTGRALGKWCP